MRHRVDLYVGEKIVKIRKKRQFTQDALAKKMGVSRQQIQKYETGETRVPVSTLFEIGEILNTDIQYFIEDINKINQYRLPEKDIISQVRTTPLNILIIEDNLADERLTISAIENSGFDVNIQCASDGQEAVDLLRNNKGINTLPLPELIILDLNIPKKSGFEVLKIIKNDRNLCEIPVVVLTSSISSQEMRKVYSLGASGFIVKSFSPDEFFEKMDIIIKYWATMVLPSM